MHIQTETIESLFNDSYRFLRVQMIRISKKNVLFRTLHNPNKNIQISITSNMSQYSFHLLVELKNASARDPNPMDLESMRFKV